MRVGAVLVALLTGASVAAQSNAVPGTDISVYEVGAPFIYGRTGGPWPNGTAGIAIGHSMSNCGSVHVPWVGYSGSTMLSTYPRIAFLLAREEADGSRVVQISGKTFLKHSRYDFNFGSNPPCLPCQVGPPDHFRIGCYDVYGAGFNGSQMNLGPTTEVDPWLGTWEPLGSYFDIGDPQQAGFPALADAEQSLVTAGMDAVKNRMAVREQDLIAPGTFRGQCQVSVIGEPVGNRDNNIVSREVSFAWNGFAWVGSLGTAAAAHGSVLEHWSDATTSMAGNGVDDGRFLVAVKVTGPVAGMWHYEYAVHNIDNHRGGASLRIPMCATARVDDVFFRDVDQDDLNDWTHVRTSSHLEFHASADNPHGWNTIYNFAFDCDASPLAGNVHIDQARSGPGALTVDVATQVPGVLGAEHLGDGCGVSVPSIYVNGAPTSPNAAFAIEIEGEATSNVVLAFANAPATHMLAGGCTQWIDGSQLLVAAVFATDASGRASVPLPIPAGLSPVDYAVQAFELSSNGAVLGLLDLSNGLKLRTAASGCP